MEEHSPPILEYAELLLDEEKAQEACLLLTAYIKRNPASAPAWWVLSRAVEDVQREINCLERALQIDPTHAQARARLDELKAGPPPAPSAPPPAQSLSSTAAPVVSPFVFSENESVPEPEKEAFDLFAPGAFQSQPAASVPPADMLPVSTEKRLEPAAPKTSEVPVWAEPRKKRTWVVDAMVILLVFCVLSVVVGYFVFQDIAKKIVSDSQATLAVAQALTNLPPQSLPPTWTPSATFTPIPTETLTSTPVPPTITPTLLHTLTKTIIPPSAYGVTTGLYPPNFSLTDVSTGTQVNLEDYAGRPILLFFWATWCTFCRDETPNLQAIYETYQEDGLVVLAVNQGDPTSDVSAYRASYELTFPVLLDPFYEVTTTYKASTIPHHVFIGSSGRIMFVVTGELSYTDLENKVKATMRVFPTPTP